MLSHPAQAASTPPRSRGRGIGQRRVLVLHGFGVRLYESRSGPLSEVRDGTFPLPAPPNPPRRSTSAPISPSMTFAGRHRTLVATAIRAVERRDRLMPVPLIVVGSGRDLRLFAELSGQLEYSSIRRRRPGSLDSLSRFLDRSLTAQGVSPTRRPAVVAPRAMAASTSVSRAEVELDSDPNNIIVIYNPDGTAVGLVDRAAIELVEDVDRPNTPIALIATPFAAQVDALGRGG